MIRECLAAILLLVLAHAGKYIDSIDPYYDRGIKVKESDLVLYGMGNPECREDLLTFSVGSENHIKTIDEWFTFVKTNPFFVAAITDANCEKCC